MAALERIEDYLFVLYFAHISPIRMLYDTTIVQLIHTLHKVYM